MDALTGLLTFAAVAFAPAGSGCELDRVFVAQGWIVHAPEEFNSALKTAEARIETEQGLSHSSTTPIYNEQLDKMIYRVAFEQPATPGDVMIDELVVYADLDTNTFYEVRWFDGKHKHLVHTRATCANAPLPWADNSMW